MPIWVVLAACRQVASQSDPMPHPSTTTTPDTTDPLPTTETAPDPCEPSASMAIVNASAISGRLANQVEIEVTTSEDVGVAVRCTAASDASDVHLLEDTSGIDHHFDLGGLLSDEHYECLAAAICPTSAAGPFAFAFDTGEHPADLAPAAVTVAPTLGMTGAYTMFNVEVCDQTIGLDWIHLVDPVGRTRWWHGYNPFMNVSIEARYHGDDIVVWGGGYNDSGRPRRVHLFDGEVYDSASSLEDYWLTVFHHDGKQLADGRILTLEADATEDGPRSFEGFDLRLHDPATGSLSWNWRSQQAVDNGQLDPGAAQGDVWHANWADVAIEDGKDKLYVSLCFTYEIVKIDPLSGEVEWVFGPGGDFALLDAGGNPLSDDSFPECQHGLEVEGDRLLVYDNGRTRLQSRAVEYELDTTTMTATELWSWWGDSAPWFYPNVGDIDYLPNGRVLIDQAQTQCTGDPTSIVEFDPATGEVASTVQLRTGDGNYRAERLDGCEIFANATYCATLAARNDALQEIFE
jgi:hypothetical protein